MCVEATAGVAEKYSVAPERVDVRRTLAAPEDVNDDETTEMTGFVAVPVRNAMLLPVDEIIDVADMMIDNVVVEDPNCMPAPLVA